MGDKSSDCHPQPRKNTSKMSATPLAARGDRINKLNPAVIHEYSDSLKPTCSEVARVESNGEKENTDSEKQRLLFKGAIDRGGENKAPDPNQTTREDLDRDTTSDVPATGTEDFRALLRRLLKDNNDIPGATTDDKTEHLLGVAKDIKHIKEIVGLLLAQRLLQDKAVDEFHWTILHLPCRPRHKSMYNPVQRVRSVVFTSYLGTCAMLQHRFPKKRGKSHPLSKYQPG